MSPILVAQDRGLRRAIASAARHRAVLRPRPLPNASDPVPRAESDLQAMIDAAPDGGTVVVPVGVHRGPFTIRGKRLALVAARRGALLVAESGPALEIVGASASLEGLALRADSSSASCLFARSASEVQIRIDDCRFSGGRFGLTARVQQLLIRRSSFGAHERHGLCVRAQHVELIDVASNHNGAAGFYAESSEVCVRGGEYRGNRAGGLVAIDSTFVAEDVVVAENRLAGLWLERSPFDVADSAVVRNQPRAGGAYGDGVVGVFTSGIVMDTLFADNEGAAIANLGSTIALSSIDPAPRVRLGPPEVYEG